MFNIFYKNKFNPPILKKFKEIIAGIFEDCIEYCLLIK